MKSVKSGISKIMAGIEKTYGDSDLCSLLWQYAERILRNTKGKIVYPDFFEAVHDAVVPEKLTDARAISEKLTECDGNITYPKMSLFCDYAALWALMGLDIPYRSDKELCDTVEYLKTLYGIPMDELLLGTCGAEAVLAPDKYFMGSDDVTKNELRSKVTRLAKHNSITEAEAARIILLSDPFRHRETVFSRLYIPTVWVLTAVISLVTGLLLGKYFLLTVLLILPISELSKQICDTVFSRIIKSGTVPKLKLTEIPDGAAVLCVITSLLSREKDADELSKKISDCFYSNRGKNVFFGLLLDLPEADSAEMPDDEKLILRVREKIDKLNEQCGNRIFLFIRSRKFSVTENAFMGWERKRGAIIELCRLLNGNETSLSCLSGDFESIPKIKYVITLDSDTRLYNGAVRDLVGAMLHPSNRPVIKDGRVVSGYGVMQPRMEASLRSAEKTPFSVLSSGNGGTDIYASAAYEAYQCIFGEGIFCGKGIFDADVFRELIDGAFPDESVLSHDLLEGTRLRAAALTDISLTDDLPKNPLSCLDRMHRWIRGDIQALMFTGKFVKNADCDLNKNPITSLSRYKIYDNVRRAFLPVFAVIAVITGMFLPYDRAVLCFALSLSYLAYPCLVSVVTIAGYSGRRFHSYVIPGVIRSIAAFGYGVASLLETAVTSADAIFRAFHRMLFSGKHLLEWKTASESDRNLPGLFRYLYRMLPSLLIGASLAVLCPIAVLKLIGILWFSFPFAAFFIGREFKLRRRITKPEKEEITEYAADIWKFFADTVTEKDNFLPPDNRQFSPTEVTAHRTSPTNIGLYLLCCIAASDFGFITFGEAVSRISKTFETLDRMQKWNGHLYNWYDTENLSVLGEPYISTVDSGNFIVSLVALRQALNEKNDGSRRMSALTEKIGSYIEDADLSCFYDEKKKQLTIGINAAGEKNDGCYDLLASECRTTSYYAIAAGQVPREHWKHLGRILISRDGYIGLASWTGTMFEYLMPSLLLPSPVGSLLYESIRLAVKEQCENDVCGIWGRSESGYFEFDADMNYQYRAFGTASLGIKRGLEKDSVISPYSSFMCLSVNAKEALDNLALIKKLGAYGDYGFYESLDFSRMRVGAGYAVIKSYMAHHAGMSLIACANACFDGIFVKRFMSDPVTASSAELLEEKIPVDAPVSVRRNREYGDDRPRLSRNRITVSETDRKPDSTRPYASVISEGGLSVGLCSNMLTFSVSGTDISVNPFVFGGIHRPRLIFSADGKVYDALSGTVSRGAVQNAFRYRIDSEILMADTVVTVCGKHRSFVISFQAEGDFSDICPMLMFEPCLAPSSERERHPAYSDLMITAEYFPAQSALVYVRRSRETRDRDLAVAVSLENYGGKTEYECRRDILGLMYTENDINDLLFKEFSNEAGTLINPLCALKKQSECKSGKYLCNFLISVGKSAEEALFNLASARNALARKHRPYTELASAGINRTLIERQQVCGGGEYSKYAELFLSCAMRRKPAAVPKSPIGIGDIWRYGISGDLPVFTVTADDALLKGGPDRKMMTGFVFGHKYLALCGIKSDLVLLYRSRGEYSGEKRGILHEIIESCGCGFMVGHSGGIFLVDCHDSGNVFENISVFCEKINRNTVAERIFAKYLSPIPPDENITVKPSGTEITYTDGGYGGNNDGSLSVCGGKFTDGGFTVFKAGQKKPWSYVYAKGHFGTLVTANSLGYTWIGNSHERRITPYLPDALLEMSGERLILNDGGIRYDMCACADTVTFGKGGAVYSGNAGKCRYTVTVAVSPKLPCKVIGVECDTGAGIEYRIAPLSADGNSPYLFRREKGDDGGDLTKFVPYVYYGDGYDVGFLYEKNFGEKRIFILGACPTESGKTVDLILRKYGNESGDVLCAEEYRRDIASLLPKIKVRFPDAYLSVMTEYYLPYQALVCRFFGRTGFFQSGGAYGFRDQLQDILCIMRSAPEIARTHIIRCAAHQYEEGDVMHWWHTVRGVGHGVRTRCSDDYLWLPYVTSEYIALTSDSEILDVEVPYITSRPLSDDENDRYEKAEKSKYRESLYYHLVRAVEHSFDFGKNGLPFIGGCDWNDGMNRLGHTESVWLGFFLSSVLERMIPLAASMGDLSGAAKYREILKKLRSDCEKTFDGDRYCRAILPDGRKLGTCDSIDLLPQAYAAICGFDGEKSRTGLQSAVSILFDREHHILKLLYPPYDRDYGIDPGYISSYPHGIRENGGQYTHASVWAAMGCADVGMNRLAAEILTEINPARISSTSDGGNMYLGEPYFIAGDVSAGDVAGRCGWSLYTGAAGWYYIAVTEKLAGLKFSSDSFTVTPHLSAVFPSYSLKFSARDTSYTVTASIGSKTEYRLDGKIVNNLFYFDKKSHLIEITVEIF